MSSDLLEGDIGDVMDMEWSTREITADFSDRNRVAEVIKQFPIASDVEIPEEQLDQMRNCATEMIFSNGSDNYAGYLNFLRESGETVHHHYSEGKELPADSWEVLAESCKRNKEIHGLMSRWGGLVLEGSGITIFEAKTSDLPLGEDLVRLRNAITTFSDVTDPPISLDDMLKDKGKVIMADVKVFIAHDDSLGGVVWPYMVRYWYDPVHNAWRVQGAALFQNRRKLARIALLL